MTIRILEGVIYCCCKGLIKITTKTSVIEKEKGSTYYINNTAVRRKDVADLFLGTGLGSHGYAIIGQNTVSQIVEAKPEELKNYLEEAAGVSKYKERRKDTEYRLRDTRDNLSRVQDLLREINQQITRLESQAQAATKHNELQEKLKFTNAQILVLKNQNIYLFLRNKKIYIKKSKIYMNYTKISSKYEKKEGFEDLEFCQNLVYIENREFLL